MPVPVPAVVHKGLLPAPPLLQTCYAVQPSKTVAQPLSRALARGPRGAQLQQVYTSALASATRTVQRVPWLQRAPGLDPARLTVSLAESLCFRAAAKPVTFTLKLWGSWQVVLLGKRIELERRAAAGRAR